MLELDAAWNKLNDMTCELAFCEVAVGESKQHDANIEEGCVLQDELSALTNKIEAWINKSFATID